MRLDLLSALLADRAAKRPVVLVTDLLSGDQDLIHPLEGAATTPLLEAARQAQIDDRSGVVEIGDARLFLTVFNPPLRLAIIGAVHIAQPLSAMARMAGYGVSVIDPREAFATRERFPDVDLVTTWPDAAMTALGPDRRTAVVLVTHDPKLDDPALHIALRSDAFYVGALGSRKTHARRCDRLRAAGFDEAAIARVRGPVGLDIGAKSPAEIAVSILAEMTATLRRPVAA